MQNKLLFKVYTYINLLIQKHIFRKKIKSIDFFLSRVLIKKSKINNRFNLECAQLICQYYRKYLNLDFQVLFKADFYYVQMPFLKIGFKKDYNFSESSLAQYILQNSRYINALRIANKNCIFKVIWLDCHKHNCFMHNNEVYPLDLECFAFIVYDRNGVELKKIFNGYNCQVQRIRLNSQECFIV